MLISLLKKAKNLIAFHFKEDISYFRYSSMADYKQAQILGNLRKESQVWAQEEGIKYIANYLQGNIGSVKCGLCHGTRNGVEQAWFKKYLGMDVQVLGTEISPTAIKYPDTIEWDFHDVKPEWVGKFDFIYSNALDHSHNPELCLGSWVSCLNTNGVLIVEWSLSHVNVDGLDPFGATLAGIKHLVRKNHKIQKILKHKIKDKSVRYYIVISSNNKNS